LDTATKTSPVLGPVWLASGEQDVTRKSKDSDLNTPRVSKPRSSRTVKQHHPKNGLQGVDETERDLTHWLNRVGLLFDPFTPLDAGDDARLNTYLIGSDIFEYVLWGDWHSFLFAPQGGGKTAFRVRLAHECRVGRDGRSIFPIPYRLTTGMTPEEHLDQLGRAAAAELLLELVHQPTRFERLSNGARRDVRQAIEAAAPGLLGQYLPQLDELGSPSPLVQAFDPSASHLPNPPHEQHVRTLVAAFAELQELARPSSEARQPFDRLLAIVCKELRYESVYILLDGVDDRPEAARDPAFALRWLEPIGRLVHEREAPNVFLKAFFPEDFRHLIGDSELSRLTGAVRSTSISWDAQQLIEMLRVRVSAASEGAFDSLDAISGPRLRHIERTLVEAAGLLPRNVLALAHQLLVEHIRRTKAAEYLEPEDLRAALDHYNQIQRFSSTASL